MMASFDYNYQNPSLFLLLMLNGAIVNQTLLFIINRVTLIVTQDAPKNAGF